MIKIRFFLLFLLHQMEKTLYLYLQCLSNQGIRKLRPGDHRRTRSVRPTDGSENYINSPSVINLMLLLHVSRVFRIRAGSRRFYVVLKAKYHG